MKIGSVIVILAVFSSLAECRRKKEISEDMKEQCAVQEMNIRARGTFIISYVDQFDKIGVYNITSPDNNGDKDRDSVEAYQPDSVGRRKLKKILVELSDISSRDQAVKKATDKLLAESIKLMGNDVDDRRINIFNTKRLELPFMCKTQLSEEELIKMSQRASNFSFCWVNATGSDNFGKYTYLDFPYLDQDQFAQFYICSTERSANYKKQTSNTFNDETNKQLATSEDDAQNKYIRVKDIQKQPEALYQFVMGKHPVGMPISWLRFMAWVCSGGATLDPYRYMAQEGDKDYSDTLTVDYKEKIKKQIELAKKQIQKRLDDRSNSMIISRFRFSKKHKHEQIVTDKVVHLKSTKKYEKKLNNAAHTLDSRMRILASDFDEIVRKLNKKDRRLKKNTVKEKHRNANKVEKKKKTQKYVKVHKK